ncbi:flagellar basal body L-ring protein FlgH [Devosia sp.]|uniref:flagellar basal body L-ring protein FlgH n=1 Tax=Devosia sp. TaxID=1871048 RepID=UPI003BA85965
MIMNILKLSATAALVSLLAGCATIDKLASVGEAPKLTAIADPTAQQGYRPVQMPMPEVVPVSYQANSLFSTDARGFFKDQRAHKVGDILTVTVTIDDSAKISNTTDRSRSSSSEGSVGGVLGSIFGGKVPLADVEASGKLSTEGALADSGTGSVNRKESLETQVAVVVTQVLPNGNLVIEGHQEVRVNFEVRDMIVAGIVRPEDVQSDNTIASSKIAEARISYGGRGQITDVQQPRYGQQIADAILPF